MTRIEGTGDARVSRRTLLRMGAGAALTLPALLAACGETVSFDDSANDLTLEVVRYRPPISDLADQIVVRSKQRSMMPYVRSWPAEGLAGDLAVRVSTNRYRFDPETNRYPALAALVVVPAIELGRVAPLL